MSDQWCEQRMWRAVGVDTKCEIVSLISALSFFIIPFRNIPRNIPGNLTLIQCCMCQIGLGTMIFHAGIPKNPLYVVMDYYPMILFGSGLLNLYISQEFKAKHNTYLGQLLFDATWSLFLWLILLTTWALMILYMLDDEMVNIMQDLYNNDEYLSWYNTINVVLVVPMLLVFAYYSYARFTFNVCVKAWALLVLAMAFYFANYLGCQYSYWLAIFHGLYHITMAFALWYIACMGVTLDDSWKLNWFTLTKVDMTRTAFKFPLILEK